MWVLFVPLKRGLSTPFRRKSVSRSILKMEVQSQGQNSNLESLSKKIEIITTCGVPHGAQKINIVVTKSPTSQLEI